MKLIELLNLILTANYRNRLIIDICRHHASVSVYVVKKPNRILQLDEYECCIDIEQWILE